MAKHEPTRVVPPDAELQERLDELEAFCHYSSHSLRSPLGTILNLAAVLQEDLLPRFGAEGAEHVERMVRSSRRAVTILDSLIAFSAAGRNPLERSTVEMKPLVESAFEDAAASVGDPRAGDARATELIVGDLPAASADRRLLRIVFVQLLANALKFVRKGERPRIEVTGAQEPAEIVYSVADDGPGFDAEVKARLFRPVPRASRSGMGLVIAERIVRHHGGRIWAADASRGARVAFALPRV